MAAPPQPVDVFVPPGPAPPESPIFVSPYTNMAAVALAGSGTSLTAVAGKEDSSVLGVAIGQETVESRLLAIQLINPQLTDWYPGTRQTIYRMLLLISARHTSHSHTHTPQQTVTA